MSSQRSVAARYGVATGAVVAAVVFESLPAQLGERKTLFLLNGAVLVAGWYGGRGPAVLAVVLAALVAAYYVLPPYLSFALGAGALAELALFLVEVCITAVLVVAVTESRTAAQEFARRCRSDEEQLRKVNMAHRALSVAAEALVHSEDEETLLEQVCRAIVEVAGYRMCWVGRAGYDERKTVRPIVRAGYDDGYVDRAEVTWADTERGRGPVGTAIRTGRPHVPQDVEDDAFAPWRAEARAHGYASVIALPLRVSGQVFGALTIYAAEKDAFDADAVALLTTLAHDLAFGIEALRARACVAAERARFESLIMNAPIAVAVCVGPDHVVRLANRRWFALRHGIESVGKPVREILPPGTGAGALRALDEAYATGEPRELTEQPVPRVLPDGSVDTRFYNIACQPLACGAGLITDVIVVVTNVTEQVDARRALEEARSAAEQASRAKGEFLRIASHELRTPLTPILGWAKLLEHDPHGDLGRLERGLAVILANARVEARLVDDLIDLSQFVAGTMILEKRPVDLGPLVQACVDEAHARAEAKGIRIEASLAPDAVLWGDGDRLSQVVRNLLSNALKFTPRGGRVLVEVAHGGDALTLRVRDTGAGIPATELPHVFEPFRIGDASVTRAHGGLGLGLAIVRYIVEAHGGTVRAESAGPGQGATLVAELPAPARGWVDGCDRPPLAVAAEAPEPE